MTTPILSIRYTDIVLHDSQIDVLRAAIAGFAKNNIADSLAKKGLHHNLFHNHQDDGTLIERAPLVLYHISGAEHQPKCFSITGIADGAKAVEILAAALPATATIQGRQLSFQNSEKTWQHHPFQLLDGLAFYGLYHWVGFTNENYQWWLENPLLTDRIARGEKLIADHLANLLKNIGSPIDRKDIKVFFETINATERSEIAVQQGQYKRTELCMSLSFMCNLQLPTGLGIGAYTAKGYGQIRKLDISPERQKTLALLAKKVL